MTRPAAVVRHASAGRLEPDGLLIRYRELEDSAASGPAERRIDARLQPGSQRLGPFRVRVAVDAEGESVTYEVSLEHLDARPVWLRSLGLGVAWRPPDARGSSNLRFLRQGWQSWSFAGARSLDAAGEAPFPSGAWLRGFHHAENDPPPDRSGWHESDLATVVGVAPRGPACSAGLLETGHAFGVVYLRPEAGRVSLAVEQLFGSRVEPGDRVPTEAVRFALGDEASRLLERHAEVHGERAGARSAAPFRSGWCSWYHFFQDVAEASFLRNLEALSRSRSEFPIDVVQLDDGYQRAVGDWLETNEKFPRGLAPLAGAVRDAGFTPGIWIAPFCVVPESRVFEAHREWLLRDGGELLRGLHHAVWTRDGWVFVLDPSHEAVRAHLSRVAGALVALGFAYLKLDFLYTAALAATSHAEAVPRARRLRLGLEAIRQGAGPEAFLLGCGCPLGAAVGVVDAMRIGPDVAPAWEPPAATRVPGLEATLPAARNALRNTLVRAWMHRRLWLNDPDCLLARAEQTALGPEEVRSLAAAIAATGGLAVLSDDLPTLSPERRALARETLELARSVDAADTTGTARAVDLLEHELPGALVARSARGKLFALVNAGDRPAWRELPREADAAALEPLLGSPKPEPSDAGRLAVELAPHASGLYRAARPARLAVFCDFDGTFAVQDVGSTLARRYAGGRRPALWARLERGELTAWEYNLELLDGLELPEEELEAFLRSVELDPGARELLAWCERHDVPFRVLSDGFDRNLDRLQQLHGIHFEYEANRLRYQDGAWRIEAGRPDPSCSCGTGVCKRALIEAFRSAHPGFVTVHVGNGRVSDLCAAETADVVFAKDSLAETLAQRQVPFEPFSTLHDVRAGLERLLARMG